MGHENIPASSSLNHSSDQLMVFQSSVVQFWRDCVNSHRDARDGTLLLLRGLTSCVFRDALLHTMAITSGYLS